MPPSTDATQDLVSRIGGLHHAIHAALNALAIFYGEEARVKIEALRDETIDKFRNSDISPEREMDHAKIVSPAIQAIEVAFEGVLRDLR